MSKAWAHNTARRSLSARRLLDAMVVIACIAAGPATPARAELSIEYCRELLKQKRALAEQGTEQHLNRGPEWARENLTPRQIGQVGLFIALQEQIRFQCPVGFDNAVVAAMRGNIKGVMPDLPVRPPEALILRRKAAAAAAAERLSRAAEAGDGANAVPLPVRNPGRAGDAGATTGRRAEAPVLQPAVRGWRAQAFKPL